MDRPALLEHPSHHLDRQEVVQLILGNTQGITQQQGQAVNKVKLRVRDKEREVGRKDPREAEAEERVREAEAEAEEGVR